LAALLLTNGSVRAAEVPRFSRHVEAVFSRAGCNGGACHGAVKGQNGFRLSLFAADPALDHERILREVSGRRVSVLDPDSSLLLLKATGCIPHQGGKLIDPAGTAYDLLRGWIAAGATLDDLAASRIVRLQVSPAEQVVKPGASYTLKVMATFADGSTEDVTAFCSYETLDRAVARVSAAGRVEAVGPGDVALLARYRAEPALALAVVPRPGGGAFPALTENNFIDKHVLAKLRRLNLPPAPLADDATFLRRVSLDVAGELPTPAEVREFLADSRNDKRARKIEELLARPGHAALWTLKFCDLLKASDFGVYADGISQEADAPRFAAWVRARLEENTPYDEFVERILTATSRDGRSVDEWSKEVVALAEGYTTPRTDLDLFVKRKTLDLYWQRRDATGVKGALQVAHSFLGLRLECAQCHRHPHDVWQQDDLLSFANFFMRVRGAGFQGDNEKKFPDTAAEFKRLNAEIKRLTDEVKKRKEAKPPPDDAAKKEIAALERQSKYLDECARRVMHAETQHLPDSNAVATVTSHLGTQTSKTFRLLGEKENLTVPKEQDPRQLVAAWMRRPDNPYFARAIINRVWAHYFGRGIVDPQDNLSRFNPPTHPELLDELCREFIKHKYDLRWLHRTIVSSRTYQQSSAFDPASATDRTNYAYFYYRRLGAEVLLDALNQATGTTENMDMKYYHWPENMKAVEIPFPPRNAFVNFMLEQFGRPQRNSAVQCDCERDGGASVLQVLSFANHPRVWQKIAHDKGLAARVQREIADDAGRVDELFLATLSRPPSATERDACLKYLKESASPAKGLQGILWTLLNTREFVLQH
jgi:hypothetical protein